MLLDVLVHPEGPRLRDRVSHGEVSLSSLFPLVIIYDWTRLNIIA